jgi:hypothetical protein
MRNDDLRFSLEKKFLHGCRYWMPYQLTDQLWQRVSWEPVIQRSGTLNRPLHQAAVEVFY